MSLSIVDSPKSLLLPEEDPTSHQELFPCSHAETVDKLIELGLSVASLSDDFKCHQTNDTYQFGLCKKCAQSRLKKSIAIIDEVRR